MMRRALLACLLAIAVLSGLGCQAALGYWSGEDSPGSGSGTAEAAALLRGDPPIATEVGSSTSVLLKWGGSYLSNGVPASGYIVKRYQRMTAVEETLGAGCSGTVAATTCTETEVPVGDWEYSVTPTVGSNWRGPESVRSGHVNTGSGLMTLATVLFGGTVAPLPALVTGTISGFAPNAEVSFLLDDSVPLEGTPPSVEADGTAAISVTLPAGISDGPHSLSAVAETTVADAGILVDNTPPTIAVTLDPVPNAAGWNSTSPVHLQGTFDDGDGSGVANVKYSEDGSDPRSSPTAKVLTAGAVGQVSVSTTTTFKFVIVDNAGNESAVQTQEVKIDTTPPNFTVSIADVEGGAYQASGNTETGEPGIGYYRGVDAGSIRFLVTPLPLGGSPVVVAGFSKLPAEAVGFSLDPTSVTTPTGGPFLSNPLSWVAGTTSTASGTISLADEAGNTIGGSGSLVDDSTSPAGGSVEAGGLVGTGGRYSTSLTLSLNLAKGTDTGSGLADGSGPSDVPARLLRASAPLSSDGVANGSCGAYSAFTQVGGDRPPASLTDTVPTDNTCYRYHYLVSDHVGNIAAYADEDIKVQTTAAPTLRPTDAVLTPVTDPAWQSVSGSTVFYNPAQAGSFNVESTASAPYAGIAQMSFPAIAGFNGGGVRTTPVSANNFSSAYTWAANGSSASPGAQALSATNNLGQVATNDTAFAVVKDALGPSGGSVEVGGLTGTGGRYSTSTTLSVAFGPGADAGSGLAASGAQLLRASAPLTSDGTANGACGSFGPYVLVANDPLTPKSDFVPADRTCYRYEYLVHDRVGNQTIYTSGEVKVDATAQAAPVLSFAALINAYWSGTGTTVFYRPGAASGGFQVSAGAPDPAAGTSYAFPVLPAGWSGSSAGVVTQAYSWSAANPTAPSGAQIVTATNNAGSVATSSFTATLDSIAPVGGSVSYANGSSTASTASIVLVAATDSGSGIGAAILQRSSAPLSAGACGSFGAFSTIVMSPVSPVSNPVTAPNCYQYRYVVTDNVGNQAIFGSASVLKVEVALTNSITMSSPVGAYLSAGQIYFNRTSSGSFALVDALTGGAGPASVTYPAVESAGWTHAAETVTAPSGGPYASSAFSWKKQPNTPGSYTVSGRDSLGAVSNTALTFVNDESGPSGGSVAYLNGTVAVLSVPVTTVNGTDSGSGVNAAAGILMRDETELNTTTGVCKKFPGKFTTIVTRVGGADTSVANARCYQYRYIASDNVGNKTTYTSSNVVKVNTAGP